MRGPGVVAAIGMWGPWAALGLAAAGCDASDAPASVHPVDQPKPPAPTRSNAAAAVPDPDDLPPTAPDLPPDQRAIQVVGGIERTVDADLARERGLVLVDLSDEWSPAVLHDGTASDGAALPNRYRTVFVGLANDRTDGDGQPLGPGEKNYLELYGIPPSLSVLRERFITDVKRICDREVDVAKLAAVPHIETRGITTEKKEHAAHAARGARLRAAQAARGTETLEALAAAEPRFAKDVNTYVRFEAEQAAFAEVEKRLVCEGLLDAGVHRAGRYDGPMRKAVVAFQQKHAVLDHADLNRPTLDAMSKPLLANDFAALRRVITERAIHAGGILEDGTAPSAPASRGGGGRAPVTYLGVDGQPHAVPDLAGQATDATMARLGLRAPEDAVAFFRRHGKADFAGARGLRVAVRFAPLPEYYSAHMDLSAEIDRGDVWYDFPFDPDGERQPQPRERYPSFTLFVNWRGERVPLIRWRTTVGGWRTELAVDGDEYYRYKISDVGPRVWRHVVAAPVWIPPDSSPLGGMIKEKRINGAFVKVTNYDETGPGYLSAYGLVAAIHVKQGRGPTGPTFHDNGIRTHGSFDYMSLRGRFSHGCHRLYNNLALRLFTFVVQHRKTKTMGTVALGVKRSFWHTGEVYEMRLPAKGFYYELDPPLPVETLEGMVKGAQKAPITGYVRKPGVAYQASQPPPPSTDPEAKAGGTDGAP